jgi:hypothetical protein
MSEIPGWHVAQGDDGKRWTAHRCGSLSPAQLDYGCRLWVGAHSLGELRVACLTEDVKAGLVATAEKLAHDIQAAQLKRTQDTREAGR